MQVYHGKHCPEPSKTRIMRKTQGEEIANRRYGGGVDILTILL